MDVDVRRMLAAEDGVHDVAEPGDLDAFLSSGPDLVSRAELVMLNYVEMKLPLVGVRNVRRQHDKHFVGTIGDFFQKRVRAGDHLVFGLGMLRNIREPLRAGAIEAKFLANGRSVDTGRPRAQEAARKKRAYYNRSDNRADRNTQK